MRARHKPMPQIPLSLRHSRNRRQSRHLSGTIKLMTPKQYFQKLAALSTRLSLASTDQSLADRLNALAAEFAAQARESSDADPPEAPRAAARGNARNPA
jgi:hypothetical protein